MFDNQAASLQAPLMSATVIPLASLRTPYIVSVYAETRGPCAACDGCSDCEEDPTRAEVSVAAVCDREPMSWDDLASTARGLGPCEPSDSYVSPRTWYTETEGSRDRAYFERGEETERSLHVSRLDGRPLTAGEVARLHEAATGELPKLMDGPPRFLPWEPARVSWAP